MGFTALHVTIRGSYVGTSWSTFRIYGFRFRVLGSDDLGPNKVHALGLRFQVFEAPVPD